MACSDTWVRACEKFKEDLSEPEKRLWSTTSPESLLDGTLLSYQMHEVNSKSFKLIKALEPFVSTVRDYGAALDVLANTYSLILSPVWGSLKIVIQLAESAGKYFEKLVEMFARIADVLPRLRDYERLFSNHDRLLDLILNTYIGILHFCIDAKNTFRKRGTMFKHLYWRPFQLRFEVSLVDMRNRLKNVEKEAMLSHMIETSKERSLAKRDESLRKEIVKAENKARFLTGLSSVAYDKTHRRASKLRHQGSCGWLLETNQYREWKESAGSAILSVVGNPGCGKTLLASSLVDEFASEGIPEKPILYYYCDYSDPLSLDYSAILGTLLKQLLLYINTLPPAIETRIEQLPSLNVQRPSDDDLQALFTSVLQTFDEVIIILDAIDECDSESQKDIVNFVKYIHSTQHCLIRCIIFSREEARLVNGFQKYPTFKISPASVSRDITTFVKDSIAERVENGDLVLKSSELQNLILSTLIEGANGMFLYVRLLLDELCEASSDNEIRRILQELPVGLTETYKRILGKIMNTPKCKMARRIFSWLVCVKRALELSELVEAIAFRATDEAWDADSIPDGARALQTCKNLVVLDEETQQVRFVHHTVHQLLSSQELLDDVKLRPFSCTAVQGSNRIAQVLCAYLCFSDFETQLTRLDTASLLQSPDLVRTQESLMTMPHEMPLGTLVVNVWKLLRGLKTGHEVPTIRFPESFVTNRKALPKLHERYRLLDYAVQHWLSHIKDVAGRPDCFLLKDDVSKGHFESLALSKTLPFDFRPWGNHPGTRQFPHMPMFRWAVKSGNLALLDLIGVSRVGYGSAHFVILRRYCVEEMENDRSPLLWAVENGLVAIFTALDYTNIRRFLPHTPRQLLCAAASQPLSEVLTWVLEKTQGHVDVNDLLAALLAAVQHEHDTNSRSITRLTAAAVQTLIVTTKPFEPNAKPRRLLNLSTVSFCKILDWALNDTPSNSLVAVLTTHVLVPSLRSSESIINHPYVFTWAVANSKAEFMRHFMSALPFETLASNVFWEAAESVASSNDQESEVVKIIWSYLQPIDPAKYFNSSSQKSLPRDRGRAYLANNSGAGSTAKGSLLHWLNGEPPSYRNDGDDLDEQQKQDKSPQPASEAHIEADANRNLVKSEVQSMLDV